MKRYKKSLKLAPLEEEERIYFTVPYERNRLAKYTHCGFDEEKKLWFTGCHNSNLLFLINTYSINENTSEKAMKLLEAVLNKK